MKKKNLQYLIYKNINKFFDIKNILPEYSNVYSHTDLNLRNINKELNLSYNNKSIKNTKKIKLKKLSANIYKNKIIETFKTITSSKVKKHIKSIILHGSYADNGFIKYWSDIDAILILEDKFFKEKDNIYYFKNILKKFFKKLLKFSPLQHHGLEILIYNSQSKMINFYSEIKILEYSKLLYGVESIRFKTNFKTKNNSLKLIQTRKKYLKEALKTGCFRHHMMKNKSLNHPISKNINRMYQLATLINFILNIPILYFSSIKRPINKKYSFSKFKQEISNEKILFVLDNCGKIRKNWKKKYLNKNLIPKYIFKYINQNFIYDCYIALNELEKIIKKKSF